MKLILSLGLGTFIVGLFLLVVSPFLVNFGPDPFWEKIISVFIFFPIDGRYSEMNIFLILSLNGLFWTSLGHLIYYLFKKNKGVKA